MNYAVLLKDIEHSVSGGTLTLRTGGVYQLATTHTGGVKYRSVDTLGYGDALDTYGEAYGSWYEMSATDAQLHFTAPEESLDSAIEESFLVCEATYC